MKKRSVGPKRPLVTTHFHCISSVLTVTRRFERLSGDGGPAGSRQNTVPFLETVVNAAEVDPSGRLLFTSFGGDVRIWDLSKWASFGRLVSAVNSPRYCMVGAVISQ